MIGLIGDEYDLIKVFDFNGDKIKEIKEQNNIYFIDTYYDKTLSKNYIIIGNECDIKTYDYNENKLYHKYEDIYSHKSIIINDKEKIIKLIDSSDSGYISIWNFHSGELLKEILINDANICGICLWNNEYLFVGCDANESYSSIKLVNLTKSKVVKVLETNSFVTIKKIKHPKYGECLISQGLWGAQITLFLNKNNM